MNDLSTHGVPGGRAAATGGAAVSSSFAASRRRGSTGERGVSGVHEGSLWYVPGTGEAVCGLMSYAPAGTKNEAIQTSSSTAPRTVKAVGNLNFRFGASACGSSVVALTTPPPTLFGSSADTSFAASLLSVCGDSLRKCFQTASRSTARAAIATMAANVSGALRSVSTAKNPSTTAVAAIPSRTIAPRAPVDERSR